jgi:hypothetical protein
MQYIKNIRFSYNVSHNYLEMARSIFTTIHKENFSKGVSLDQLDNNRLANLFFCFISVTVLYSYLAIESFVNYQLFQIWEKRHNQSIESKRFLQLLGDPSKFEKLKDHKKVRELGNRVNTICQLLAYKKPSELIPRIWQDFKDLVELSRHFFVHPYPDKDYFHKNMERIASETKTGKYVRVAEEILTFFYEQGKIMKPKWLKENTLLKIKGIELLP